MNKCGVVFLCVSSFLGLLFYFVPAIDLWAAGIFYDHHDGVFLGSRSPNKLRHLWAFITTIFIVGACSLAALNMIRQQAPLLASTRSIIFLLLTMAIGPGLFINTIVKNYSGRARPFQVLEFGGDKQFSPAFVISDECARNCSFVSGDAALGYYGLAVLFVARRRRLMIASAALFFGTLIGFIRMAQGAHFLSDVIFSGVLTFLIAWALYFLLLRRRDKTEFANKQDTALEKE